MQTKEITTMAVTAKVTAKGQITLPKNARDALGSDVVEIEVEEGRVLLRPVRSLAGALRDYAREGKTLNEIREEVWGEVARDAER
jgi:AbrB family looped-hinge helix DNA binding protein